MTKVEIIGSLSIDRTLIIYNEKEGETENG